MRARRNAREYSRVSRASGRLVKWGGRQEGGNLTYAIISGEVDPERREAIKRAFNSAENLHGEVIKALLVSKSGAEGYDFKNIREIYILESYWDKAREDQVRYRGVRMGSHDALPRNEREVQTYLFLAAPNEEMWSEIPEQNREPKTTDEWFHLRAMNKYELNQDARNFLTQIAYECAVLGYGNCLMCVPTDAVLYHDDPELDLRLPNPCEPIRAAEVAVQELKLGERVYYYASDADSPLGYRFYEFRTDLDGYAEIDLSEPVIGELLKLVK